MGRCLASFLPSALLALALGLLVSGAAASADDERLGRVLFPGESPEAGRRLEAARKLAGDKNWADTIEAYQRLIDTAGDEMVSLAAEHCLQVRWLCHRDLSALPAEALRLYRDRIEGQARKWLDQALATRDERLLRRVADEAFCSPAGAVALDVLGDLAFERGRFDEAEAWWRLLVAPATGPERARPLSLVYPADPPVDVALVRAKQLLARLLQGRREILTDELPAFARLHGKAGGQLAGQKGNYTEILADLAQHPGSLLVRPARGSWPTFAGDRSRNGVVRRDPSEPRRLRRLCLGGPTFRFDLRTHAAVEGERDVPGPGRKILPDSAAACRLAFHPVIVDDHVLVADARYVTAYDCRTGGSSVWYDLRAHRQGPATNLTLPAPPELRYTLSVGEGHVLARMGTQTIRNTPGGAAPAERLRPVESNSFLVCLHLEPDQNGERVRWEVQAAVHDQPAAVFEGAPVLQDGRVYIAATCFTGSETVTAVHCYPLYADNKAPLPLWHQDVCAIREEKSAEPRYRHHLLTLAGPLIVYASHSGAIVALDAITGRHVWGVRYPSGGSTTSINQSQPRDLVPCVFADGRLFVAPADYQRLLCLDARTGRTLWERDRIDVVHLLGTGNGRLIFTTPEGIRAVSTGTGADADGWYQPNAGGQWAPFGRGFLLGDLVFWPTARFGLQVLQQEDGQPPLDLDLMPLQRVRRGNLAYADSCLAVADTEQLTLYVAPNLLRSEREQQAQAEPESPMVHWRLALAEADAGRLDRATQELRQTEVLAGSVCRWQGRNLAHLARTLRHETLLELAERAARDQQWERAVHALGAATATEFSVPERLHALERLANLWTTRGQRERALGVWQEVLDSPLLRRGQLTDSEGNPQAAVAEATRRMAHLRGQQSGTRSDSAEQPVRSSEGEGRERGAELLSLPLRRVSHVTLAADERLLAEDDGVRGGAVDGGRRPVVGDWFFTRGSELTCRDLTTGSVRWTRSLPLVPRWIGRCGDGVWVGGPQGVVRLGEEDGRTQWEFLIGPLGSLGESEASVDTLSSVRHIGPHLFCLQGDRCLLALDAGTGRVVWTCWAPGGRRLPAGQGGRFVKPLRASGRVLAIQTASGYVWVLDASTGRRLREFTANEEMTEPRTNQTPSLGPHPLVMVTGVREVVGLDPATGALRWKHILDAPTTLRGIRPRVVEGVESLLLVIPRNYAWTLKSLDPQTGQSRWPNEVSLGTDEAVQSLTLNEAAVYFVAHHALHSLSVKDGAPRWDRPLSGPEGSWRLRTAGNGHLASWSIDPKTVRCQFRWLWGSMHCVLPMRRPGENFSVALWECASGRLVQRLNFAVRTPPPTFQARVTSWMVFGPELRDEADEVDRNEPAVVVLGRDFGASAGRDSWGLTAGFSEPRPSGSGPAP
jgi:outer membrane protein assembly factor BamB